MKLTSLDEHAALAKRFRAYVDGLPAEYRTADLATVLEDLEDDAKTIEIIRGDPRFLGAHSGDEADRVKLQERLIENKISADVSVRFRAKVIQALDGIMNQATEIDDPKQGFEAIFAVMMGIANFYATVCMASKTIRLHLVGTMCYCIFRAFLANPQSAPFIKVLPDMMTLAIKDRPPTEAEVQAMVDRMNAG